MGTQAAKCPACRHDASLRERFGCDKIASRPVWQGTCEFCIGRGCDKCDMRGERIHYRCPASMTDDSGKRALEFACALELGFLPAPGAYGDQVHSGMAAVNIARMEKAKIERSIAEANAQKGGQRG